MSVGFLKQLGKVVVRTATLPASVVKDVVTLGGVNDDSGRVATLEHLKKLSDDIEELPDSIGKKKRR